MRRLDSSSSGPSSYPYAPTFGEGRFCEMAVWRMLRASYPFILPSVCIRQVRGVPLAIQHDSVAGKKESV
jgi:hypothetical protein